jgi:hypothetical protein
MSFTYLLQILEGTDQLFLIIILRNTCWLVPCIKHYVFILLILETTKISGRNHYYSSFTTVEMRLIKFSAMMSCSRSRWGWIVTGVKTVCLWGSFCHPICSSTFICTSLSCWFLGYVFFSIDLIISLKSKPYMWCNILYLSIKSYDYICIISLFHYIF